MLLDEKTMTDINILYDSDNFLVVNKPPDLLINSNDEDNKDTLHHILLKYVDLPKNNLNHGFHFIHRLDFATSGIICLGKNKIASAKAGKLFESRLVNKYYLAIVRGLVKSELTTVNISIGYDDKHLDTNKKMCIQGNNCVKPKEAVTKILKLEEGHYNEERATKILLKPLTGRRHQLRLHCHSLGHTIVGDYTYSDRKDVDPPRMFLHSYRCVPSAFEFVQLFDTYTIVLVIPVLDEKIDLCTSDPFPSANKESKGWCSENVINELNEDNKFNVFEKIDNYMYL